MDWKDKEYLRRVDNLSIDTMRLISQANTTEEIMEIEDVIMTTDSEEEIVKKVKEILKK